MTTAAASTGVAVGHVDTDTDTRETKHTKDTKDGTDRPSGPSAPAEALRLAEAALEQVGENPRRALRTAEEALRAARAGGDAAAVTTALRARGLASRATGDLALAERSLRQAVTLARRRGDAVSEAEARMTLSFVLLDLGRVRAALQQSASAAQHLEGTAGARLLAQRALILQRCGRDDEAIMLHTQALGRLREAGDWLWELRVRSNRGIVHAFRGSLSAAEVDLGAAERIAFEHGRVVDAAMSEWNLGWVASRRGDAVGAIARFDRAGRVLDEHDVLVPQRLVDRAELLLSIGAAAEARQLAEQAAEIMTATREATDLVECRVLLARAAMLEGRPEEAAQTARLARIAAGRQQRPAWELLGRHLEVLASEAAGAHSAGLVRRASAVAVALEDVGWTDAAADARLAAARLALAAGRRGVAAELLRPLSDRRGPLAADVRVRRWHATALLRLATGDEQGARSATRAALGVLERHRAGLGASDLQVHVRSLGLQVAQLGLRLAIEDGDARGVHVWLERWRARDQRSGPVRPPDDPDLSRALEQLRQRSTELATARMAQSATRSTRALQTARIEAEREVQRLARLARPGPWTSPSRPVGAAELRSALNGCSVVELAAVDDDLVAVTLRQGRDGVRLHRLGSLETCRNELSHLQFALSRMAAGRGSSASLQAALRGARASADRIDQALFAPLDRYLDDGPLVVVPTGGLHALPWGVLPRVSRRPLHVVPSASAWLRARAAAAQPTREVYVSGPGLEHAPAEAADLADGRPGAVLLTGPAATARAVLEAMDGASLVHLAAHGTFNEHTPMLSALHLADGPLNVYDLEALGRPPETVVLAACHSAVARVHPGDELLGVANTLLGLGTRAVVATSLPTPDAETSTLVRTLHEHLRRGGDAAQALWQARRGFDLDDPAAYATVAGFATYGA